MTAKLNHLLARERQIELTHRAEQARLASEARAARSVMAPPRSADRLRIVRWLRAARPAAAGGNAPIASRRTDLRCHA